MIPDLPRGLAPWANLLGLFPGDLALSLGELVRRLALAVGPLTVPHGAAGTLPMGYQGLTRRGPYDRLLISEWLLAQELPDEFVRRAVMGEHLFLQLAAATQAGSRRSVVLFDAGPSQLGSPRLAHLAALIVLARRAEAGGAAFAWGIVQDPGVLLGELSAAGVMTLINARSGVPASTALLEAWRRALPPGDAPDDCWLVTDPTSAARPVPWPPSRLAVRDLLEPETRRVAAEVWRGGTRLSSLLLDLPAPAECVRLLRDPFAGGPPVPVQQVGAIDPAGGILFPGDGLMVVRLESGAVLAQRLPNSPRITIPPWIFAPRRGTSVVAVGAVKGRLQVVTAEPHGMTVHLLGRRGGVRDRIPVPDPEGAGFVLPPAGAPLEPCLMLGEPGARGLLLADAGGQLFWLALTRARADDDLTAALAPLPATVLGMTRDGGGAARCVVRALDGSPGAELVTVACQVLRPRVTSVRELGLVGAPWFGARRDHGLLGLERADGGIVLMGGAGQAIQTGVLHPPGRARVVGIGVHREAPGIVVLEPDRRTLSVLTQTAAHSFPAASTDIVCAAVSPYDPLVAYLTEAGELVLHRLRGDEGPLLRLVGGAS